MRTAGLTEASAARNGIVCTPPTSLVWISPERLFALALGALLLFRLWLSYVLPFTVDEAYYVDTGRHPGFGIYDHPPMVSWWVALQLYVSDREWWLRLLSVLQPLVLAFAVRSALPRLWPKLDRERASWIALLVAFAPLNVWNVLVTTDIPLIYFCGLSGLAWVMAARSDDARWYLISGILLAGAVLSKYFAFLLGFAYLIDVAQRRSRRAWVGLAIAYLCTVPALALMVWWNAGHCWVNVMFNFFTRNRDDAGLSWRGPLLYAVTLAYTFTPLVLLAWRDREVAVMAPDTRTASLLAIIPLSLFAALAFVKVIGLYWVLGFVVFAFLPLAPRLPMQRLRRFAVFFGTFAALHMAVIIIISQLPLETWKWKDYYPGVVLTVDPKPILEKLTPYEGEYVLASDNYAVSSTLGYVAQQSGHSRFIVFGEGSYHGRQDDIDTDFRTLGGRNILILTKTASIPETYRRYFHKIETVPIEWRGAPFWIVLGRGFDYPTYRDNVLVHIRKTLYTVPAWLPQIGCFFCERYFPGETCVR